MEYEKEYREAAGIAQEILAGEIPPALGAKRIWRLFAERIANTGDSYPRDIRVWVGLASEWEDSPSHREAYEADILDEARLLVERYFAKPSY